MIERTPYRLQRGTPGRSFLRFGSIGLAICAVALNWAATQRIATLLGYRSYLNGRIVRHLYQPFAWWWWAHRWPSGFVVPVGDFGVPIEVIWKACERFVIYPLLALGLVGGLVAALLNRQQPPPDLHGSASWSTTNEIKKAGLL